MLFVRARFPYALTHHLGNCSHTIGLETKGEDVQSTRGTQWALSRVDALFAQPGGDIIIHHHDHASTADDDILTRGGFYGKTSHGWW
jgi:hypothetical protein